MPTLSTSWTKLAETSASYSPWAGNFALWARIIETDVAGNRTKVAFSWDLTTTAGTSVSSYDAQDYVTAAGWNEATYRTYSESGNLRYGESWITHNSDGTKSDSCSGRTWMGGVGIDTGWITASFDLPRIPRASVPTASPNPCKIWQGGQTLTVNTNRKSSSFTHTISVRCGTWSWASSARAVGASVAVPIPYTIGAQIPATSKTTTATVTCVTYSGTTQIGSAQTCTVTIQINTEQDHPNIGTITVSEQNSKVSAIVPSGSFVYGVSKLQATIPFTVSGSYTQLASAVVTFGNTKETHTLSGTSQTVNTAVFNVNVSSLSVTVTDKRGTTATKTASWTLLPYLPLTATATVGRPSATGSAAVGQVSGIAYGGTYGESTNSLTISYKYKEHNSETWTDGAETYTQAISSGQQTYTRAIAFSESFDYQKQYDIAITVSDLFSTATYTAQLMQGLPIISWDETEVDVWGSLHIHDRDNPTVWQDVMQGFDAVFDYGGEKNLCPPIVTATTTVQGVTWTPQADGTIKTTGTSTGAAQVYNEWKKRLPVGKYKFNGCPSGGSTSTYFFRVLIYNSGGTLVDYVTDTGEGNEFEIADSSYYIRPFVSVNQGTAAPSGTWKPMIRDARIASDTFAPPTIQSTLVSITGKSSRTEIYKFGKVVFFASPSDGTYSSGLTNIGTIPEGYRPAAEVRIPIGNDARTTRFIIIQKAGEIMHYANNASTSNANFGFTACWITYE